MYATDAEVRAEYVMALWDVLEGHQRLWVDEEMKFLNEHPELMDDPVYYPVRDEFMNELFNCGDCEWTYANTFSFFPPDGFVIDSRLFEILGAPKETWFGPNVQLVGFVGRQCISLQTTVVDSTEGIDELTEWCRKSREEHGL